MMYEILQIIYSPEAPWIVVMLLAWLVSYGLILFWNRIIEKIFNDGVTY